MPANPILDMLVRRGRPRAQALQLIKPKPRVATGRLVDRFDDNRVDTGLWPSTTGCSEVGGRARVPCTSVYQGYTSRREYSLQESLVSVEVPTVPAIGNSSTEVSLEVQLLGGLSSTTQSFKIVWAGGFINGTTSGLLFREQNVSNSDTSIAYDATAHRWWRIREASGTVYWETSPDGVVWTERRSKVAAIPLWPANMALVSGYWGTETAPGNAEFDNFNVVVQPTIALDDNAVTFGASIAAHPQPLGNEGGWNLQFSDEFQGSTLDTVKWFDDVEWYGGGNTLDPVPPEVWGSTIHLVGKDAGGAAYTNQNVQTGRYGDPTPFAFTYGYVEAKVNTPLAPGSWPAVWLVGDGSDQGVEIDLGEWVGSGTHELWMTVHYSVSLGGSHTQGFYGVVDWHVGWNTIGVNWQPGLVVWYVNGVERFRVADSRVPSTPMYVILDHWVADYVATPDPVYYPADFRVQYIRVWQ